MSALPPPDATCPRCGKTWSDLPGSILETCTRACGWERGMRARSTDAVTSAKPSRSRSKASRERKKARPADFSVASALVRAVALSV